MTSKIQLDIQKYHGTQYCDFRKEFKLNETKISVILEKSKIILEIESEDFEYNYSKCFIPMYELLFFASGYFFQIESYLDGENTRDLSKNITCYFASNKEIDNDNVCIDIQQIFDSEKILKYSALKSKNILPFNGLFYLQSTSYEGVLADHRVVILLQITQGMLETFHFESIKKEKVIFEEIVSRIKKHQKIAHEVSKNVSQQESDLLKLIAGDDDIVNLLKQTRDCLSHFTPKESRLHNFQLVAIKKVFLVELRIFVLEQIGIKNFNIDNIAEYYLSLFDWIKIDIKNELDYKPMSMIYKIRIGREKSRTCNIFN